MKLLVLKLLIEFNGQKERKEIGMHTFEIEVCTQRKQRFICVLLTTPPLIL